MATTGQFRRELQPPARAFYQREFGSALGRERRGWAQTKCPFHDGQSKTSLSLNLDRGGFKCFSCGAHGGDVIAFVRLRYNLSFADACRELGCWDETGSTSKSEVRRQREARAYERAAVESAAERRRRDIIDRRDWLHLLERLYRDSNTRLSEIRKGAPEQYAGEQEVLWGILSDALPQVRTAAAAYSEAAGVPIAE